MTPLTLTATLPQTAIVVVVDPYVIMHAQEINKLVTQDAVAATALYIQPHISAPRVVPVVVEKLMMIVP
jgi:hypothetical protein